MEQNSPKISAGDGNFHGSTAFPCASAMCSLRNLVAGPSVSSSGVCPA